MTAPDHLPGTTRATAFSRLDFRSKLAVFVGLSVIAVCWDDPRLSVGLLVGVMAACAWVGVPLAYLRLMVRVMTPFFVLLLATHGFFNVGHVLRLTGQTALTPLFTVPTSWFAIGGMSLSWEGLLYGINVICKSLTFLLLVPLCVFTTDPNNLIVGLVRLRLPYKLAFVIASTLRFFPLIFDEIRGVMETQRLRGYDLAELSSIQRVRAYGGIAVPVILGAMFKAQQIEVVLQAKAFSGRPQRTYLHESTLRPADYFTLALVTAAALAVLLLRYFTTFGAFTTGR